MDIDPARLETSRAAAQELVAAHGADAAIEATPDRREALAQADYVVTSFQVGGLESTLIDFEIPKRYGLRQTIGDTLGVGGISRALRTIPVLLDVCADMEELCPDALLLQYANPMAMLCWAVAERSSVRTVGLCHSVQHTTGELAADLGVPAEEIDAHVAASTTSRSSCASSAAGRTSTRRCARSTRRRPTASAMRCCATSARS